MQEAHQKEDIVTAYRRQYIPGASWFFTVNLAERKGNRLLVDNIDLLRDSFACIKRKRQFDMDAVVIMPDHLHCIWTLPPEDAGFSTRWSLIKSHFSRAIEKGESISGSRNKRRERGVWQRRFWEHLLRDQADYNHHVNYIHWNPVKHGLVERVADWPHSSFHKFVAQGVYPVDWCSDGVFEINGGE